MSEIEKQWYVVNTYSGHEQNVKENLEKRVQTQGLENNIFQIIIAEHEVPVMKKDENGIERPTGKTKIKNMYPGYIFVQMIMSDDAWFIVRNTPGVTGFVGSSGGHAKPFPVPRDQIEPVLKRLNLATEEVSIQQYHIGDRVKVIYGTFENSEGIITHLDEDNRSVDVEVDIFGKLNTISVSLTEIELAK